MSALFLRAFAAVALSAVAFAATPASASECTYTDLLGKFEVSVDCEGLKDHSNLGNEQKRIWLAGDWGQVNIIEVPSPYKQDPGQIDLIMSNLGRVYTARRSPGGIQETTVAGQAARVVLEHKMRTSSRSWVFHWQGRNLIMRAVAYGKKKERMANLDKMSAALTNTFTEATGGAAAPAPAPVTKEKVRDRKVESEESTEAAAEEAPEAAAKEAPEAATEESTEAAEESTEAAEESTEAAEESTEAAEEPTEAAEEATEPAE